MRDKMLHHLIKVSWCCSGMWISAWLKGIEATVGFPLKLLLTPFCISYSTEFPLWQTWQSISGEYQTKIKTSIKTVWFAQSCTQYARCLPVCWIKLMFLLSVNDIALFYHLEFDKFVQYKCFSIVLIETSVKLK